MTTPPPATDWAAAIADEIQAGGGGHKPGELITVASGISPSGPVHLGNLREIMTQHFVADELARRGENVRHILSWDDYDRYRRVPAGFDPSFAEHIGRPLSAVPDPCGQHDSWAEHFKQPLREALAQLHIQVQEISQTQMYTDGAYAEQTLLAMRRRAEIDQVLARYRTKPGQIESEAEAEVAEGVGDSGGAVEEEGGGADGQYYPFVPYCAGCGRDHATITSYDEATTKLSYRSECGYTLTDVPLAEVAGKLAWKVDWPMRWAYEQVTFEPAGVDHSTPGSSRTVGAELVGLLYGGAVPHYAAYSFVGIAGMAKMSSSAGAVPTPGDALQVMEAPVLRWQFGRRRPNQSFTISFGPELTRLYDEWDALVSRVESGAADPMEQLQHSRAVCTAGSALPQPQRRVAFKTLASISDITAGEPVQLQRIVADLTAADPAGAVTDLAQLSPRLECAVRWMTEYVPAEERTQLRTAPNAELIAGLEASQREGLRMLLAELDSHWSLEGLTSLLYGIPKRQLGVPLEEKKPTPELKKAQRAWFVVLYQLLTHSDTGPRLPTLLLALGQDRVRELVAPAVAG